MTPSTPATAPAPAATARRQATRARLLDAAFAVYAEQGVHASTVEQIAERAGFTRGAFYSNFTTKEELFVALMEREDAARLAALETKFAALRPRLEASEGRLDADAIADIVLSFFVGPFDDHSWHLISTEFQLLALRDPAFAQRYLRHRDGYDAALSPMLERTLRQSGRVCTTDPMVAVRLLAAVYDDAVRSAALTGTTTYDPALVRDTIVRVVLALTRRITAADR
ncbi:MAG: TetR/AcrR family transcriptional regulator [Micrococcales bacterium]|nr:TetR/AcrR family transcriptional regulator [Micrococcales bacterium]